MMKLDGPDYQRQLSAESEKSPQIFLLFMFVGLFVGSVITYILTRYAKGFPYTVIIFLVGILAAVIDNYSAVTVIGNSLDMWIEFPPDLIIFIFLPVLLYGDSMTLNPHHVNGAISSALLLAGPGALIGMYLTAVLCFYILPYSWSWDLCCLFGAILCATDPVAVIALLHQANASPQLSTLIIGEALLNDGAALVLFNMYFSALEGNKDAISPGNVVVYFIKVIFISPLLGVAMGFISVLGISIANRRLSEEDKTIQMSLTISSAYLSFFVGEHILGVSGVVTCCSAGFIVSLWGTQLILDKDSMQSVWAALEWIANTLLFLLAGLIIGNRAVLYAAPKDFAYIVVVYLLVTAVRIVLVTLAYPILARTMNTSLSECIFMTWAGLRGGVALALVLLLESSARRGEIAVSVSEGHHISLLVGGFVTLTLVINAVTSGPLLKHLQLVKSTTSDQLIILSYVRKRLKYKSRVVLSKLMRALPSVNFEQVSAYCSVFEGEPITARDAIEQPSSAHTSPVKRNGYSGLFSTRSTFLYSNVESGVSYADANESEYADMISTLVRHPGSEIIEDLLHRVRLTFLEVVRQIYWQHIKEGKIPRNSEAATLLLYSIDIGLDTVHTPGLQDWDMLSRSIKLSDVSVRNGHLQMTLDKLFRGDREETAVFTLLSFIDAHEEAQHKIPFYLGETEFADTPEEALVVRESQEIVSQAKRKLSEIPDEIIEYYNSRQAARVVLHAEEDMIAELRAEGILKEGDAHKLLKETQKDFYKLNGRGHIFLDILDIFQAFLFPSEPQMRPSQLTTRR